MVVAATVRVIYGDTDAMGVVYHANYLRFFELGRNEYMRARGVPYRDVEARGLMLPVTEATCRYVRPARYDDVLTVETRVTRARGPRVGFAYRLLDESGGLLAEGHTEHAAISAEGKPQRLPPDLIETLAPERS